MDLDKKKTCCFTGHRPEKCKGTEEEIRAGLLEEIKDVAAAGFDTFITGMAAGVDTWAAEEVLKLKEEKADLKLICAVPFRGMEKKRTPEEQETFRKIIEKADDVTYISQKYARWCFLARDRWMVDHASRVIAVFNGTHGGTEYTINYAKQKEVPVVVINDGAGRT